MDRLTETDFCTHCRFCGEPSGCNRRDGECDEYQQFCEMLGEMSDLARAKQEGRLIELPCKVGDRISASERIEEIIVDEDGIDVNISESYSCKCGSGIRHRREKFVDTKLNLCDSCQKCFADCNNGEEGKNFFFGTGIGNDNVYKCRAYKPREAAEAALKGAEQK